MKRSFLQRVIGAIGLDPLTFEEVEADESATWQAAVVVILSSLAAGLGTTRFGTAQVSWSLVPIGTASALVAWFAWALLTYYIGTKLMPQPQTRADFGQMLRTIGFASAPGLFRVFLILPVVQPVVFTLVAVWMLAAMVIAVRQALDYDSSLRALGVCVLGWILTIAMALVIGLVFSPTVQ